MGGTKKVRIVDPVLTNLARGYTNAALVGLYLFPRVEVEKEAGKIPQFGKNNFKLPATERALGAKSNRIEPDYAGTIDYSAKEHDIEYPVDYREASEAITAVEKHAVRTTEDIIGLRIEVLQATAAQAPATYAVANKKQLAGGEKFSDTVNSDPVSIIEAGKEAIRQGTAKEPNVMVIAADVFKVLKTHPKILEPLKYTGKSVATVEDLKSAFGVENIHIGKALKADAKGVTSDVWTKTIVMAYVPQTAQGDRTEYEPAYGYTLAKRDSHNVDTYDENGGKISVVRTTDILDAKVVGSDAGYLIYDAI